MGTWGMLMRALQNTQKWHFKSTTMHLHIVLLGNATIKLGKLKIVNDTVTSITGKLRKILSDAFKCTEIGLSYVCNNISTPMAPLLCIRLRWDLRSDFFTCAITFQHQWLLYSALHWGKTCSSLQGSCKFNKDWQRHQGNKKKQIETKWPELHHAQ